jgi:hypothetical protein
VRRHVAAELQHDLPSVRERDRANIAAPALAVHVGGDIAAEGEHAPLRERHPPDGEEVADGQPAPADLDHARRRERPQREAAAASHADVGGDDDRPLLREQLEMSARRGKGCSNAARNGRGTLRADARRRELRSVADRCRDRRRDDREQKSFRSVGDDQPSAAPPVTGLSTLLWM